MFVGRLMGWVVLGLAFLLASGDVVLALGTKESMGIATGDVWFLLVGRAAPLGLWPAVTAGLLALPAWSLAGPLGIGLIWTFRPRRRYIFR